MKSAFKMVSAFLVVMLVLVVFPATSAHAACTNAAAFIMDKAPLDNTKLDPGATFSKSWVVQNVGTCTWDSSYELVNIDTGGDPFGGTPATVTTSTVGRYQTITLTVNGMTAPAGHWNIHKQLDVECQRRQIRSRWMGGSRCAHFYQNQSSGPACCCF